MTDITIPNVGESVSEVTIAQWFKAVGDTVKKDEPLVELETDKAAQELVSPEDGVLEEILVAEGENAEVGKLIAKLGSGSGTKTASKGDAEVKAQTPAPASKASTGGGPALNIDVPNVGESVSEVTIASWMVAVGDAVKKDQALVELETDKAAQELVAPRSGVITEILKAEGDVAKVGETLCKLGESDSASPSGDVAGPNAGDEGGGIVDVPSTNTGSIPADAKVMPAAAKIIRENGLDASLIKGTGKDSRITKADALAAKANPPKAAPAPVAKPAPATPKAPRDTGPREDRVRMTRIRQTIARRLKDAQNTAAMLTTYNEADMSAKL